MTLVLKMMVASAAWWLFWSLGYKLHVPTFLFVGSLLCVLELIDACV